MSVIIETTLGDITVDLFTRERPRACQNFLKLCKIKYYNFNLFHTVSRRFIAQTGDPTGSRNGGESIFGVLDGPLKRFFVAETNPRIKHTVKGLISFVGNEENMIGSQFFFTLGDDLTYLDGKHCVFGEVTEGLDVLDIINEAICDSDDRPYQDIRITHTVILDDPLPDLERMVIPSRSPSPSAERLQGGRIAPDEEIDEIAGKNSEEINEMIAEREAKARATILEMVGDLPDADMAPPENVLFVCKLNPVTSDDDLEIIFSRFGKIKSCEVIRDHKTGDSLQYAFIEFEDKKSCEDAYFKMDNVLIDDRRIHVDFSQSVSKVKWMGKGRGVKHFSDTGNHKKNYDNNEKDYDKQSQEYTTHERKNSRSNYSSSRSFQRKKRTPSPRSQKEERYRQSRSVSPESRSNYSSSRSVQRKKRTPSPRSQKEERYRQSRSVSPESRSNYSSSRSVQRKKRTPSPRSPKEQRYRQSRSVSLESRSNYSSSRSVQRKKRTPSPRGPKEQRYRQSRSVSPESRSNYVSSRSFQRKKRSPSPRSRKEQRYRQSRSVSPESRKLKRRKSRSSSPPYKNHNIKDKTCKSGSRASSSSSPKYKNARHRNRSESRSPSPKYRNGKSRTKSKSKRNRLVSPDEVKYKSSKKRRSYSPEDRNKSRRNRSSSSENEKRKHTKRSETPEIKSKRTEKSRVRRK